VQKPFHRSAVATLRPFVCLGHCSIRKIAGATGLSSSRIHQLSNAPEVKEIPVWLSQLRQSSGGSGRKKKAERLNGLSRKPRSHPAWREKLRCCDAALTGVLAKTWL
jgi:hypothetical protein